MTKMLASVTNVEEALWAVDADVDIIDLKDPSSGALGALPLAVTRNIVHAVNGRKPVSATIGDLPMHPPLLMDAIEKTAACGSDIIKVGFFPSEHNRACIRAIAMLIAEQGLKVVAVLPADLKMDFSLPDHFAQAGFFGVMLDTFNKDGKSLFECVATPALAEFVDHVRRLNMQTGLAGSLRMQHIETAVMLNPDYIGFRGALCHQSQRSSTIVREKISAVHNLLHKCNKYRETASA